MQRKPTTRYSENESRRVTVKPALTGWFVRVVGELDRFQERLPSVAVKRARIIDAGGGKQWVALTDPCQREQLTWALRDVVSSGWRVSALRALS